MNTSLEKLEKFHPPCPSNWRRWVWNLAKVGRWVMVSRVTPWSLAAWDEREREPILDGWAGWCEAMSHWPGLILIPTLIATTIGIKSLLSKERGIEPCDTVSIWERGDPMIPDIFVPPRQCWRRWCTHPAWPTEACDRTAWPGPSAASPRPRECPGNGKN